MDSDGPAVVVGDNAGFEHLFPEGEDCGFVLLVCEGFEEVGPFDDAGDDSVGDHVVPDREGGALGGKRGGSGTGGRHECGYEGAVDMGCERAGGFGLHGCVELGEGLVGGGCGKLGVNELSEGVAVGKKVFGGEALYERQDVGCKVDGEVVVVENPFNMAITWVWK